MDKEFVRGVVDEVVERLLEGGPGSGRYPKGSHGNSASGSKKDNGEVPEGGKITSFMSQMPLGLGKDGKDFRGQVSKAKLAETIHASNLANNLTREANATDSIKDHEKAAKAHKEAAALATKLGDNRYGMIDYHNKKVEYHSTRQIIRNPGTAKKEKTAEFHAARDEANRLTAKAETENTEKAHLVAARSHQKASDAAWESGRTRIADHHSRQSDYHVMTSGYYVKGKKKKYNTDMSNDPFGDVD